ncbi:MAG TPA: hypothetical protein VF167_08425 [Longimicrobiaceae bacterium]
MARFGYLSESDRLHQADAFVRMVEREGRPDWREYFDWWSGRRNKDFHPGDRQGIFRIVEEIMVAGGASTLVDPLDWLRIGRDPAEESVA